MNRDKALHKVLKTSGQNELPFGFEQRVMKAVFIKAEKEAKCRSALSLILVSLVSLAIISGAVYVLNLYYSLSFSLNVPRITYTSETKSILAFSFYIASIVLFLLGLDSYLRRLKKKVE